MCFQDTADKRYRIFFALIVSKFVSKQVVICLNHEREIEYSVGPVEIEVR